MAGEGKRESEDEVQRATPLQHVEGRTDIVHGRSLICSFLLSAMCSLALCGLSVYVVYIDPAQHYLVGQAYALSVGYTIQEYRGALFTPIIVGSIVGAASLLMVCFTHAAIQRARVRHRERALSGARDEAVESVFGKSKQAVYVLKFLVLAFVVVQLFLGIGMLSFVNEVNRGVRDGNVAGGSVGEFALATFNRCCAARNWTQQLTGPVPPCPLPPGDCLVPERYAFYSKGLCSCLSLTAAQVAATNDALARTDTCRVLGAAVVNVGSELIPGSSLSLATFFDGVSAVRVVGNYSAPDKGCGSGFGAPFVFLVYAFIRNVATNVCAATVAISVLQLFCVLYGIWVNYMGVQQRLVDNSFEVEAVPRSRGPSFLVTPHIGLPISPRNKKVEDALPAATAPKAARQAPSSFALAPVTEAAPAAAHARALKPAASSATSLAGAADGRRASEKSTASSDSGDFKPRREAPKPPPPERDLLRRDVPDVEREV